MHSWRKFLGFFLFFCKPEVHCVCPRCLLYKPLEDKLPLNLLSRSSLLAGWTWSFLSPTEDFPLRCQNLRVNAILGHRQDLPQVRFPSSLQITTQGGILAPVPPTETGSLHPNHRQIPAPLPAIPFPTPKGRPVGYQRTMSPTLPRASGAASTASTLGPTCV